MARRDWAEASEAKNGYHLTALVRERPSWRHGVTNERVSKEPVVAITEGNMDVASGRRDPVISVRESMRCCHCGTRLQHSLLDLGIGHLDQWWLLHLLKGNF